MNRDNKDNKDNKKDETIKKQIPEEDLEYCPECDTLLTSHYEMRGEVGFYEEVVECSGCGYCATD